MYTSYTIAVKQMPYKTLYSTLSDKTQASLNQVSHIQITIFILKRRTIKHKIANCPYVHGIWVHKLNSEIFHYLTIHSSRYSISTKTTPSLNYSPKQHDV